MVHFTSNTYQMKRQILSFSNKISRNLPKPERKFIADMNYGIIASGSCLLTDIVDQLQEPSRKINIVDRLSRHLAKGIPKDALKPYLTQVRKWCPDHPVIHIDDSDVVKPDGYKFESLGWVRDGSESTATNREIRSKDDVIKVARLYFSRWKIEEYFRCKKQMFQFENFRVRELVSRA